MKKASKKIFGGLLVVMLVASIGAVIASAQQGFFSELTDEQKEELKETINSLKEEGATCAEVRATIREQLESYGVEIPTREEMLDKQIERTEQRLEILNRIKELVNENPDITQDEIRDIISEEFELEIPNGDGQGIMHKRGFRRRPGCGFCGFMPSEESDL
jgi:hypothetical protein